MTKDYAKKPTKVRTQKNKSSKKSSTDRSPWFFLIIGVLLGILISPLLELSGLTEQLNEISTDGEIKQATDADKTPEFEFYTLLKEAEVIVLGNEAQELSVNKKNKSNNIFLLQTGSFKTNAEADKLRAKLILLNLNTSVEKVTTKKNETWRRVIVGPFSNTSALAEAQKILSDNKIDSLLLKRKNEVKNL
tara:strand:- start:1636 stop:2208 length:573 start_codon:yes stop_codon:yes gene_type:complete